MLTLEGLGGQHISKGERKSSRLAEDIIILAVDVISWLDCSSF